VVVETTITVIDIEVTMPSMVEVAATPVGVETAVAETAVWNHHQHDRRRLSARRRR
jgi:hypothetical protein